MAPSAQRISFAPSALGDAHATAGPTGGPRITADNLLKEWKEADRSKFSANDLLRSDALSAKFFRLISTPPGLIGLENVDGNRACHTTCVGL